MCHGIRLATCQHTPLQHASRKHSGCRPPDVVYRSDLSCDCVNTIEMGLCQIVLPLPQTALSDKLTGHGTSRLCQLQVPCMARQYGNTLWMLQLAHIQADHGCRACVRNRCLQSVCMQAGDDREGFVSSCCGSVRVCDGNRVFLGRC